MAEQKNPPPLRFRRFGGPWDRCRLGDAVQITMGQSPDGSTYSNEPRGHILVQGNADLQNGWVKPRVWTTQVTKTARPGDLILTVGAGDIYTAGEIIVRQDREMQPIIP